MTVKELREFLQPFPDEMHIIEQRYSDYEEMELSDWSVVQAIPQTYQKWLMRVHPSMTEEQLRFANSYVFFHGN